MKRKEKRKTVVQFTKEDYIVLNYEQLLKVNGAKSGSQSGPSSGPSNSGGQTSPSSSESTQDTTSATDYTPTETTVVGATFVDNSNEGIANANVGDKKTRNDGTVVTLGQKDIEYAQKQINGNSQESGGNNNNNSSSTNVNVPTSGATNHTDTSLIPGMVNVEDGTSTSVTYEEYVFKNQPSTFEQRDFNLEGLGDNFGNTACAATSLLNEVSEQYTEEKGTRLTKEQADSAMYAAVEEGYIDSKDAYVSSFADAANAMAKELGLGGNYSETSKMENADVVIYAVDNKPKPGADHFVNGVGSNNTNYYDPWTGKTGSVSDLTLYEKNPTRLLNYSDND